MLVNAASAPTGTVYERSGWITGPISSQSSLWMCDGRGDDAS